MPAGRLIAIEGIDGSGKRTQLDLLARSFDMRGISHVRVSFPRYESFFGKLVARFLNGDFGALDQVDPHLSALLYAGDRFEAKIELEAALASGKTILADRYVGSNLAHQTARMPSDKRESFLSWLRELEYKLYGLPKEDLVIYLRVPAREAHRLIALKKERKYTNLRHDLQEADVRHLEQAAGIYESLSQRPNWTSVNCYSDAGSGTGGKLLPPERIHEGILATIDARLPELKTAYPSRAETKGRA